MVKKYPGNPLVRLGLGNAFREKGLLERAMAEYRAAIGLNPGLVDAYDNLGVALGDTGRYEEAIGYFEQAINTDPANLQPYNNLAVTYTRINRWRQAKKVWERALEIDPGFKPALESLKRLESLGY